MHHWDIKTLYFLHSTFIQMLTVPEKIIYFFQSALIWAILSCQPLFKKRVIQKCTITKPQQVI